MDPNKNDLDPSLLPEKRNVGEQPGNQNSPGQSHVLEQAKQHRQPVFNPMGRVEDINDHETLIADVRRHPIGLFIIYLEVVFAIGLSFLIIFAFLPSLVETLGADGGAANALALLLAMIVSLLALGFLFLAHKIYHANQLIITNENVTQVKQVGLFHRKVSEVSMENVEDVTAHQRGILSTFFNYGRVHIETAGEQDNYNFTLCPRPNAYAKAIQDARVDFIKRKHV